MIRYNGLPLRREIRNLIGVSGHSNRTIALREQCGGSARRTSTRRAELNNGDLPKKELISMELSQLVGHFACAMMVSDSQGPRAKSYRPGIGPLPEKDAVELVVQAMKKDVPAEYRFLRTQVPYPGSRQKCDLVLEDSPGWAIEVKMARFRGDNDKPDDTSVKDILSPYERDRSALTDCLKLASSMFSRQMAILIYGFDDPDRPLTTIIEAFEVLARTRVRLGTRNSATLNRLIHPVFRSGGVFGWEIKPNL
jgi:hypothetical protein